MPSPLRPRDAARLPSATSDSPESDLIFQVNDNSRLHPPGPWAAGSTLAPLEMLRQGQPLALVRGADVAAVKPVGPCDQRLVNQPADDLAVLDQERHLARAPFENGPAADPTRLG